MSIKTEKITKLNGILSQLKTEFVGLDAIIDELGKSIYPWYITPELNNRPVVISLWGMSGVGKSSLIKRLLELLDLSSKTLTFDCGTESGDGDKSLSKKLYDYFLVDDVEVSRHMDDIGDMIFVFDEFQHGRFIDDMGCEIRNQSLQPVFTLIDSGVLEIQEADWQCSNYLNFIGDLRAFVLESSQNAEIKLEGGFIKNPDEVKKYLEGVGLFYYDRGIPGIINNSGRYDWECIDDEYKKDEDPYKPLYILEQKNIRLLYRKLKKNNKSSLSSLSCVEFIDKLNSYKTLGELSDFLEDTKKFVNGPTTINCSKSLIFILGNLDEAFKVAGDISPDLDADVFYKETSKVTLGDIKEALKKRFRPEQIARFGNNLIKYPTLQKKHFVEIIEKELSRICNEFEKSFGIKVTTTETFNNLIYSESVFPTQGVRPVFSTINSLFNPLLSDILIYVEDKSGINVTIDTDPSSFKIPSVNVYFKYSDGVTKTKEVKLVLGNDRDPVNRKTRFINGIHEVGHAIILSFVTGKLPLSIVGVAADHGGFCVTLDEDRIGEIDSIRDIKNDLMISMGGYCAEKLVFDDDKRLLGSGSDIESAWFSITTAFYKCGYKSFQSFSHKDSFTGDGIPFGMENLSCNNQIDKLYDECLINTEKILKDNNELLLRAGKEVGEKGEINGERFSELISKYGNTLTTEHMNSTRNYNSPNYYEAKIDELLASL